MSRSNQANFSMGLCISIGWLLAPVCGYAQEDSNVLEEVIVTAQKRAQSINEIGISMDAFGGEAIKELRINNISDIGDYMPNVDMTDARPGGNTKITIRGVGVNDFLVSSNPSTSVYFDGIYIPSFGPISGQLFDLERIEVLRGPQSTLYGRNSTAGAINVISRKPTDELDSYFTIGYGNYQTLDLEGAYGGPLSENLAARVSFKTKQRDEGYMTNIYPGGQEVGTIGRTDVRAQLLWEARDDVEVLATVTYGTEDSVPGAWSVFGRRILGGMPGGGFIPLCAADRAGIHDPDNCASLFGWQENDGDVYRVNENDRWDVNGTDKTASVTVTWETEKFTFKSISAYLDWEQQRFQSDGVPFTEVVAERNQEITQASQEFQFISATSGLLDWVAGVYLSTGNIEIYRPNTTPIFGGDTVNTMDNDIDTIQAYLQTDWNVSDRTQLIAGFRYIHEKNSNIGSTWADNNSNKIIDDGDVRQAHVDDDFTDSEFSWKLGVNFHPTDTVLLYGTITKGFKSGGFFSGFAGRDEQLLPYGPETVYAYELGWKSTLANGSVQLNGALFYYDYKDIQTNTNYIVGTNLITKFDNIPKATVLGGELELSWLITDAFDVKLGVGLLDTEVGEFTFGAQGTVVPKGNELPNAPEWSVSAVGRYVWSFPTGSSLAWIASVSARPKQYMEVENVARNRIDSDATLVNSQLKYSAASGSWGATLWVNNLTDEVYNLSSFQNPSNIQAIYNLPRTYGATFSFYWN